MSYVRWCVAVVAPPPLALLLLWLAVPATAGLEAYCLRTSSPALDLPPGVSPWCDELWFKVAEPTVVASGCIVAAVAASLLAGVLAPARKLVAAGLALAVLAVFAGQMLVASAGREWKEFGAAAAFGCLALVYGKTKQGWTT